MGKQRRTTHRDPAVIVACIEQAQRMLRRGMVTSSSVRILSGLLREGGMAYREFEKSALQLFAAERESEQRRLIILQQRMRRMERQFPRTARLRTGEVALLQLHWDGLRVLAHDARTEYLLASNRLCEAVAAEQELELDADDLEAFTKLRGRLAAHGKHREQMQAEVSLPALRLFFRSYESEIVTNILCTRYIFDGIPLDA